MWICLVEFEESDFIVLKLCFVVGDLFWFGVYRCGIYCIRCNFCFGIGLDLYYFIFIGMCIYLYFDVMIDFWNIEFRIIKN